LMMNSLWASKNITVEMFHWLKQSQPFLAG
jgi:hypothetical protein